MPSADDSEWVTRDKRWYIRGPWNWAIPRELPELFREFNGIDFGHAHLAETLIRTQDQQRVEQARLEVLDFIFSSPSVPPDEEQVAPTLVRMTWEVQRTFNWAHTFHRNLYDLFASDRVQDKEGAYRKILAEYLFTEQSVARGESNIAGAEVGLRYQLTYRAVLDAGLGSEFAGPAERSRFFFMTGFSLGF